LFISRCHFLSACSLHLIAESFPDLAIECAKTRLTAQRGGIAWALEWHINGMNDLPWPRRHHIHPIRKG
jgi:hypothetical protein